MLMNAAHAVGDAAHDVFDNAKERVTNVVPFMRKAHVATDAEVDAPTPEDRWFTPREGWGEGNESSRHPHYFMPIAKDVPALFPSEDDAIGELRLEVLEAEGLPNADAVFGISAGNMTDSFALVLFEGNAARTNVIYDSLKPRWSAADPDSFRAFSFPILYPHSMVYVSINDYDGAKKNATQANDDDSRKGSRRTKLSSLNADDPIGRVAIQLGRLVSGTVYDCWFELGHSAIEKPNGKLGSVRLRFSVTFKSERQRMLGYLRGNRDVPIIPFNKSSYRRIATFAKRGGDVAVGYDCA